MKKNFRIFSLKVGYASSLVKASENIENGKSNQAILIMKKYEILVKLYPDSRIEYSLLMSKLYFVEGSYMKAKRFANQEIKFLGTYHSSSIENIKYLKKYTYLLLANIKYKLNENDWKEYHEKYSVMGYIDFDKVELLYKNLFYLEPSVPRRH